MARPKSPGRRFYLGRVRFDPRTDSPELLQILETIAATPAERRPDVIKAALLGGADQVPAAAKSGEEKETEQLLADLFGD